MIDTPRCSLNFIPLSSLPNCSLFEISTLKLFGSQLAIFPFQSTKPSLAFYRPTYYQAFSQQPQKPCCLNGRISTKDSRRQSSTRILDPGISRESQLHVFSLDHEKWLFKVSISSGNTRITICNLILVSKRGKTKFPKIHGQGGAQFNIFF